ncbi:cystathionine gamma-synthase [Corynebacterium pelargi]|uniref:Cystathionine gamma-synthase n=1 Tax=Corynebacterium pelargi TaxID=1471400 RepID=A0A410W726_9CORY|nr:cystathionine gamma-synthase [Corynebacterium pelargi]QAU51818.1 Cystathionine gamma-synthase [Corynebacterium pelargi]GGG72284.1 cystathionine gamma-synthase [Corynebacterium pelargi]
MSQGFHTAAIHGGYHPDNLYGPVNTPIYASTTFAQNGINELRGGFEYSRVGNPTVAALERTIAALEQAKYCRVFASGMAATDVALRTLLRPGKHMILGHDAYGGTFRLIDKVFGDWGVEFTVVDTTQPNAVHDALKDNTAVVWLETPTNPALSITDIADVAKQIEQHDAKLVVDNTFATPYLQRPLELGADVVLHSATKYLGGHSDVVGGALVSNDAEFDELVYGFQGDAGAISSPFDAYLTARGIKTLAVRMDRHCENAQTIAEYLEADPRVAKVYYPGLASNPGHEIAKKQMRRPGAMISVLFHTEADARNFCLNTKLILLAESLGGVESLIEHPASMTHQSVNGSTLEVPKELVRISVGIEDIEDLLDDISSSLQTLEQS